MATVFTGNVGNCLTLLLEHSYLLIYMYMYRVYGCINTLYTTIVFDTHLHVYVLSLW